MQNNLFGGVKTESKSKQCYGVTTHGREGKVNLELVNEDFICGSCPSIPTGPWLSELSKKNIDITDVSRASPGIEILIGSDLWGSLITGRMVKLQSGLVAVESVYEWTLSGVVPNRTKEGTYAGSVISLLLSEDKSLQKLWALETIGIKDTAEQISQEEHDLCVKKR